MMRRSGRSCSGAARREVTCQVEDGEWVPMTRAPDERRLDGARRPARPTASSRSRSGPWTRRAGPASTHPGGDAVLRAAAAGRRQRCRIDRRLARERHLRHAARPQPQRAAKFLTGRASPPLLPELDMSRTCMTWTIAALATAGVIVRPFDWPEAVWAVAGAAALLVSAPRSPADALTGRRQGHGRLSVPDRHDAAGGDRARGGPVRLAGRGRDQAGQGLGDAAVPAGLRGRHDRHDRSCPTTPRPWC